MKSGGLEGRNRLPRTSLTWIWAEVEKERAGERAPFVKPSNWRKELTPRLRDRTVTTPTPRFNTLKSSSGYEGSGQKKGSP